ncbi:MAG: TIGR04222 domain-containing membrane protein [Cytophagaceae bacterium]|jgi:uncharacterized protein (TIGR04222 family)|nr:TIGR04222 domain-containing membrane protein [Cytophagaceae bacterium]
METIMNKIFNLLFENPLATLHGPWFLMIYAGTLFVILIIAKIWLRIKLKALDPGWPREQAPSTADMYLIAFLKSGAQGAIRLALYKLQAENFLEQSNRKDKTRPYEGRVLADNVHPIEKIVAEDIDSSKSISEIINRLGLLIKVEQKCQELLEKANMKAFLIPETTREKLLKIGYWARVAFITLGVYKFISAVIHEHDNFLGIICFGLIGTLIHKTALKVPKVTLATTEFLKSQEVIYQDLKNKDAQTISTSEGMALVAVFGGFSIVGYNHLSPNKAEDYSSFSSSGGCSSCSGSSSGGDGGGDGCGGGCGGCGGGD